MKKTNIYFWIFTGLFSVMMLFSAIPDIFLVPNAVIFMTKLGYPNYFTSFIGVAKVLGIIAILIPGYPRIKEWAYAGLAFDLIGATYSQLASAGFMAGIFFMIIPFGLGTLSYIFYHKRNIKSLI